MRCAGCSFDNPPQMRFCGQCGTQLPHRCGACGFESPAGFQFCGRCGNSLGGPPPSASGVLGHTPPQPPATTPVPPPASAPPTAPGTSMPVSPRAGEPMAPTTRLPPQTGGDGSSSPVATQPLVYTPRPTEPLHAAAKPTLQSINTPPSAGLHSASHGSAVQAGQSVATATAVLPSHTPSSGVMPPSGIPVSSAVVSQPSAPGEASVVAPESANVRRAAEAAAATVVKRDPVRRHTTVVFCDLIDSTALSERLDPEELRDVIRAYQAAVTAAVERYDGHVAQYLGDGVLAYFGYPTAHEDDARRAVNAGLDIVEAMSELSGPQTFEGGAERALAVRIGIHTGPVVAGEMGAGRKSEQLVIGQTPNVAARLQQQAGPNEVVVSDATAKLVHGYFELDGMGLKSLKGLSSKMNLFGVGGRSGVTQRFDLEVRRGLGTLVGRRAELDALQGCFGIAAGRRAQSVLVTGEAGIGKSRLMHAFRNSIPGATWHRCRCSPYAQGSALFPLVELIQGLVKLRPGEDVRRQRQRIHKLVGDEHPHDVELLAIFLSLPDADPANLPLTPQQQQLLTVQLLLRLLMHSAGSRPTVFFVEDLHWADPSMLQFLDAWMAHVKELPVLTLMSARPAFQQPWTEQPDHTVLALERLGDQFARQLVMAVTGGRSLPDGVMSELIDKTDGVPLFVEELTKMLIESGRLVLEGNDYVQSEDFDVMSVPTTLRGSLTARLDAMGAARDIAQIASAIGRRFTYALLRVMVDMDELVLRARLDQLMTAELVYREIAGGTETYVFKHALICDTAYDSMLRKKRRKIHGQIASAIESQFADVTHARPDLLARHYEEAGDYVKAIDYLAKAGERAAMRSVHGEAVVHYERAISLLEKAANEDGARELQLRVAIGGSIIATRGYAAEAVHANYARAYELCQELKRDAEEFPALYGLWVYHLACSRRDLTEEYATKLLDQVSRCPSPSNELSAYFARGTTWLYRGELAKALSAFDSAIERYDPTEHLSLVRYYGDDHGLFSKVYRHWLLLLAGRVTEARKQKDETVTLAASFDDPLAQALALSFAMLFHRELQEVEETRSIAQRTIALSADNGFPFWASLGRCGRGWATIQDGEVTPEALTDIREGLGFFDLIEQKLPLTYWRGYLIEALLQAGEHDEALALVEETLAMARANVDSVFEPELLRLKARLLDDSGAEDAAVEACFQQGLDVADGTKVHFLALRVTLDYCRWLQRHDRAAEIKTLLSPRVAVIAGDSPLHAQARELLAAPE